MSLAAACVSLAVLVPPATGTVVEDPQRVPMHDVSAPGVAAESELVPAVTDSAFPSRIGEQRLMRTETRRPGVLPAMYVSFGALQVLDVYSTRRAIDRGAVEVNPVMKGLAGNSAAMIAAKSAATALSIYCAEKAWKRNRTVAIVLMAVLNGATATVVAHNLRQQR
jgi:Domain of unknown function (DUF5658)